MKFIYFSSIRDLVMAEKQLMKHIDALGRWLQGEVSASYAFNKFVGGTSGDKTSTALSSNDEQIRDKYEHNRRLMNPVTIAIQQAIHGLSYTCMGRQM
ncbi:hypothetical protein IFM89_013396 [Coptis chinensis]|uniref:Uncharacterized protein n=1 Tax=Coptis chinensis TaxID=261450 RepID=A0A835LXZ4_9MAGN|nr:hypothetical protein IFM89_013396 [Coptis chinensis]